jgi:hypothetical protein
MRKSDKTDSLKQNTDIFEYFNVSYNFFTHHKIKRKRMFVDMAKVRRKFTVGFVTVSN